MNKNAFKLIVGSLMFAMAIHYIKPQSRHATTPIIEEQETIPARSEAPEPEPKSPPQNLAIEPVPTAISNDTSIPHIISLAQEALPRNGHLTFKNYEEIHHVHPAILNAGMQLGHLKELWMQKPQVRKATLDFYEQCTFDNQVVDSVRALCYINAVEVSVYLKKTEKVLTWNLDHAVQNLTTRLMAN